MAILRIPDGNRLLQEHDEIRDFLVGIGIDYERWERIADIPPNASAEQILSAYSKQINQLKSYCSNRRGDRRLDPYST
jgi:cupin superfamily acireductone dioxygenase involved in methionine salvage